MAKTQVVFPVPIEVSKAQSCTQVSSCVICLNHQSIRYFYQLCQTKKRKHYSNAKQAWLLKPRSSAIPIQKDVKAFSKYEMQHDAQIVRVSFNSEVI